MTQQRLTVFFSDIANSTWLYQQKGDVLAHRMIADCLHSLRSTVEQCNGRLLRTVGDAVLASFENSDDALLAAIEAQRAQLKSTIRIRVGFHVGEVIPDAGDVYGNAVNVAARVAAFANAEEIYTTGETVENLSSHLHEMASYLDRVDFKGIKDPLPVYRIQWSEAGSSSKSADTRIVTAVNRTEKYRTNVVLDLFLGARRVRIDQHNPSVRIGRDIDNDIIVGHDSTSRHHAQIEFVRGRYNITDSSTNGTYIVRGGQDAIFVRRESVVLQHDGIIGLGWHPSMQDPEKIIFRSVTNSQEVGGPLEA
ncbi:MAG: adenylate/guanylate cyclase domain-containing protein [Granulosicoccus sp.]|nr:adenylate/guanylate cyclase domain-containing protein [Granulosicoccus sp.]